MREQLEQIVSSLLYEGYALYPYTPGATKNATPTPFGIVYPPAYAEERRPRSTTCGVECVLAAEPGRSFAPPCASCRRRRAPPGDERRLELRAVRSTSSATGSAEFAFEGERTLRGRARIRASGWRRRGCGGCAPASTTPPRSSRASSAPTPWWQACSRRTSSSRRPAGASSRRSSATASPGPRSRLRSVNTFPVLASPADDAILGARRSCSPTIRDRAGEPRQPVRQHRDRGGAAAARPGALGRRARGDRRAGPGGAGDDRARRAADAGGDRRPARRVDSSPSDPVPEPRAGAPEPGRGRARGRRRHLPQGRRRSSCGPAPSATSTTGCSTGARRRSSASTSTTRTAPTSRVTVDDDPGQELLPRDRPLPVLQAPTEARGRDLDGVRPGAQQILVAGIGNAWMRDDGFGGHVARGARRARAARGRDRARLRHRRARPRLRGDARLRRARARRRQPPGRRARDPLRDRARPGGDHADRGRRGGQPARDGPADRAAVRQDRGRLAGQGRGRRLRARRGRGDGARALARGRRRGRAGRRAGPRDGRGAAHRRRLRGRR